MINIIEECCQELGIDITKEVRITVGVCCNTATELISKVFNKQYYPTLTDEQYAELMPLFLAYTVSNVLYPYILDKFTLRRYIAKTYKKIEELCVDYCLLMLLDKDNLVQNMLNYLSELFYQLR